MTCDNSFVRATDGCSLIDLREVFLDCLCDRCLECLSGLDDCVTWLPRALPAHPTAPTPEARLSHAAAILSPRRTDPCSRTCGRSRRSTSTGLRFPLLPDRARRRQCSPSPSYPTGSHRLHQRSTLIMQRVSGVSTSHCTDDDRRRHRYRPPPTPNKPSFLLWPVKYIHSANAGRSAISQGSQNGPCERAVECLVKLRKQKGCIYPGNL